MTVKFSTGLRDMLNGMKGEIKGAVIGTDITFVDGGGSDDTITDGGSTFVSEGFAPNDQLFIMGSTSNDGNTGAIITTVVAGTIGVPTGTLNAEAGLAGTVISVAKGGSLKDIMKDGKLMIFTGSVPADADAGQGTSTLLLTITESAGVFVHGAFGNGLEFEDDPLSGVIEKMATETWQGVGAASGVAGWFMFVANPTDGLGSSTTLPRIIGSVGRTYTIDEFTFTLPAYYGA
jgi:hypothetical protein